MLLHVELQTRGIGGLPPPLFLAADIFRKLTDMNKEIETEFECNYPHPDLKIFNAVSCILNYECRLYQKQSLKANWKYKQVLNWDRSYSESQYNVAIIGHELESIINNKQKQKQSLPLSLLFLT